MDQNKYIFHVHTKGDRSVGISDAFTKITIETDFIFDKEDIQSFKEPLAELFEAKAKHVLTDEEFIEEQRLEAEWEKQMDKDTEEISKVIDDLVELERVPFKFEDEE